MKNLAILVAMIGLNCGVALADNSHQQMMSAGQLAILVELVPSPDQNCILYSDFDINDPSKKELSFTLHTASQEVSMTVNATDELLDKEDNSGIETISGLGIEMNGTNGLQHIRLKQLECNVTKAAN